MTDLIRNEIMTSREISTITGKTHSNVCRDIKKLNNSYSKLGEIKIESSYYLTDQNKKVTEYQLNKSQSLDLALGYSQELRIKLRKRWEELELVKVPQTYSEALQLAADQAKKIELQASKVQSLEEALDTSEQWISIIRASKEFSVKETAFNWRVLKKFSIENGIEIKEAPCPRFKTKKLYHVSVFRKCYPDI